MGLERIIFLSIKDFIFHSPGRGAKCDDGSKPTCSDGSAPVKDGDKSTPPCPDGERPSTCADGSTPARQGNGKGRGRGNRLSVPIAAI